MAEIDPIRLKQAETEYGLFIIRALGQRKGQPRYDIPYVYWVENGGTDDFRDSLRRLKAMLTHYGYEMHVTEWMVSYPNKEEVEVTITPSGMMLGDGMGFAEPYWQWVKRNTDNEVYMGPKNER